MRSPWKLVVGLVSRGKPEQTDTSKDEISESPNNGSSAPPPSAEGSSDRDTVAEPRELSLVEAPPQPISTGHVQAETPATATNTSAPQKTSSDDGKPNSSPIISNLVEPVAATTIRLVTKDRLSARADLSRSSTASNTAEAIPVVVLDDEANRSEKSTAITPPENGDSEAPKVAAKIQPTPKPRAAKRSLKQSAETVERPLRRAAYTTMTAPEIALPDQLFVAEMRLNDEIDGLRHELAQKLRSQNEQLKEMLARYE